MLNALTIVHVIRIAFVAKTASVANSKDKMLKVRTINVQDVNAYAHVVQDVFVDLIAHVALI